MRQFYWNLFISAFNGAWAISQVIAGAIALIAGIVVWKHPQWEASVKNLIWMIPLGLFLILLIIRLIIRETLVSGIGNSVFSLPPFDQILHHEA